MGKSPKMPSPAPAGPSQEELDRQARIEAVQRKRRGRAGTIVTGARGLLAGALTTAGLPALAGLLQTKEKLGE